VNVPDINGAAATVVVIIPGNHVMWFPCVQPCLHIITEFLVIHLLPAPNGPMLGPRWEFIRKLVPLQEHLPTAQDMLVHIVFAITTVDAIHPG